MKFQSECKPLLAACQLAAAPIRRGHIPVLECLYFVADGGLVVYGTNYDLMARASCVASVSDNGVAAVHHDHIVKWLQSIPGDALVSAEVSGDNLNLSAGRARAYLPVNHDGFPIMKRDDGTEIVGGVEALLSVAPFAEKENSGFRPAIMGVHFDGASAVATDGHRIAFTPASSDVVATIPEMAFSITGSAKSGRLFVGENTWRIETDGYEATGKLIDASYPDWRRAVGEASPICEIDADALMSAVATATLGRAEQVLIDATGEAATVTGLKFFPIMASSSAEIPCDGNFCASFSAKYLMSAMKSLAGQVVSVSHDGRGFHFTAKSGPHIVVMPIRHESERVAA